jgi:hypothetical protein
MSALTEKQSAVLEAARKLVPDRRGRIRTRDILDVCAKALDMKRSAVAEHIRRIVHRGHLRNTEFGFYELVDPEQVTLVTTSDAEPFTYLLGAEKEALEVIAGSAKEVPGGRQRIMDPAATIRALLPIEGRAERFLDRLVIAGCLQEAFISDDGDDGERCAYAVNLGRIEEVLDLPTVQLPAQCQSLLEEVMAISQQLDSIDGRREQLQQQLAALDDEETTLVRQRGETVSLVDQMTALMVRATMRTPRST